MGAFSGLYNPAAGETKEMFLEVINQNVSVILFETYESRMAKLANNSTDFT